MRRMKMKAKQRKVKWSAFLVLAVAAFGCGKADDPNVGQGVISSSVSPEVQSLSGKWKSNCKSAGTETLEYGPTQLIRTYEQFSNLSCSSKSFTAVSTILYIVGQDEPSEPGAKHLDYTVTKLAVTPHTSASDFNFAAVCGITNWQNGVTREVHPMTCAGVWVKEFGIFRVDGNVLTQSMASIDMTRPSTFTLDNKLEYVRQ